MVKKTLKYSTTYQDSLDNHNKSPVKNIKEIKLTKIEDQPNRLKEHFSDILNRPPPADPPDWEAGPP